MAQEPIMSSSSTSLTLPHPSEEKIRDYDELLDTFSLHQFIIRKGKTLANTPEFLSFSRKYNFMWGQVAQLITTLEDFCTQYAIVFATIKGQRVVELAEDEAHTPNTQELLSCMEGVDLDAIRNTSAAFQLF